MEHEKGKIVQFRQDVMAEDTLIHGRTMIARTKHSAADEIRKKAREAEKKRKAEQLAENCRLHAEQKKLQAEERKLLKKKQRRLELLMFLILLLIVILFFVLDAVIGTGKNAALQEAMRQDAVLMQTLRILLSES